jgi:predicted transcriptional regulator
MPNKQEIQLDGGRRDKHDIVMQILFTLRQSKSIFKTTLMNQLGLSSLQVRQYLGFLEKNKLIVISKHGVSVTEKGLEHFEKCSHCPMFERSNAIWKFKNTSRMTLKSKDTQTVDQEILSQTIQSLID